MTPNERKASRMKWNIGLFNSSGADRWLWLARVQRQPVHFHRQSVY